jgi:cytoskeletal protein CcmA (bactofilin family)
MPANANVREAVEMSNPYNTVPEAGSVLGPSIRFTGELTSAEDLVVLGEINGTINQSTRVTVGPTGVVNASIRAGHIAVQGRVDGDLLASKSVVVHASAEVRGNITAPAISIEPGAVFTGSIDMEAARGAAKPGSSRPQP